MRKPRVLIVLGHPHDLSFNRSLALAYANGARAEGAEVHTLDLAALDFDPILRKGYAEIQPLEPDLERAQAWIEWCDHLVLAYPVWWGAPPALVKGFADRVFLPGWAFRFRGSWPLPEKLLAGRSGHVIVTMDAPSPVYRWIYRRSAHRSIVQGLLGFCGIGPIGETTVDAVKYLPRWMRKAWLLRARLRGGFDTRRLRPSANRPPAPVARPRPAPAKEAA